MDRAYVVQTLRSYIAREILDGRDMGLDGSTPLLEWGIVNSIELVRMLSFIDSELRVKIPSEKVEAEHFRDIDSIAALVLALQADAG